MILDGLRWLYLAIRWRPVMAYRRFMWWAFWGRRWRTGGKPIRLRRGEYLMLDGWVPAADIDRALGGDDIPAVAP